MSDLPFHALDPDAALARCEATAQGLSEAEAAKRLATHGPNRLSVSHADGPWRILGRQFASPIAAVLVGAGVLAVVLGKHTDAVVVFAAVVVNALIGFIQEWRAGHAIAALSAMVPDQASVLRAGSPISVPAHILVPGDVVQLAAGDRVPADVRLLSCKDLEIEEAALTGESLPSSKSVAAVPAEAALGDRDDMAFGGTVVVRGSARAVVVATGDRTELGRINALLNAAETPSTPLMQQLGTVGWWITGAVLVLSIGLASWGVLVKGARIGEALFTAVTLAVAAIPEGLPAIITIALSLGVRRMAARHAMVRYLPAVETLGSCSAICSDKTGTLTRNEMTVTHLWLGGETVEVSGVGYAPGGTLNHQPEWALTLIRAGVLCNDAGLNEADGTWSISGDPTEGCLVVLGRKVGLDEGEVRRRHPRVDQIPFSSETRWMATAHRGDGLDLIYLKGAPEALLARCALDADQHHAITSAQEHLAAQGMRVLAVASHAPVPAGSVLDSSHLDSGCTFLGLVGLIDPPRAEAIAAIAACHRAGISVTMITGDHPATAAAIAAQLGLCPAGSPALTGADLDRLDAPGFARAAREVRVFARVAPEHKIRLVESLQAQGAVVAMTGDGVNDAPALKRADIGVAMGITGTAASKEAARIVLADDNFATIAAAVEEGRRVYDNLVKALVFVLPTNLGLAAILALAMLLFPTITLIGGGSELLLPLSPTQILWINLVASVALSAPIAFEVLEPGTMQRPPRPRDARIFSPFVAMRTGLVAALMAACACVLFLWEYGSATAWAASVTAEVHTSALASAQTMAVTTVVFFQCLYLLHCRSLHSGLGALGWFSNPGVWIGIGVLLALQAAFVYLPPLQAAFTTAPLGGIDLLKALGAALVVLPVISLEKWLRRPR